jgi:membrane-bound serine protease (ClpP class)
VEILIPIILILLGLGLLAVEVYLIPGLNIVGIVGLLVLIFGVGYAFSANGFAGGLIALLGTIALGGGMGYAMWKTGAWEDFVLSSSMASDDRLLEESQDSRARYLGQSGSALTPLRPTGVAQILDDRVEVSTEGEFIAAGSSIRVVAIDRRRIFVRLTETQSDSGGPESPAAPVSSRA